MKKAKHFKIHELVPPSTFDKFGEKSWQFIDTRLIDLIDALRDEFGSATINNYKFGGNRSESGLRTPDCKFYKTHSQHSFGRAADLVFKDITASEARRRILENPSKWLAICPNISIEDDVTWLHIDVRNTAGAISVFKP